MQFFRLGILLIDNTLRLITVIWALFGIRRHIHSKPDCNLHIKTQKNRHTKGEMQHNTLL